MHPQTLFRCSATYVDWLDELLVEVAALPDHELVFINFQDLLKLKPIHAECTAALTSLWCDTAPSSPPLSSHKHRTQNVFLVDSGAAKAAGLKQCEMCESTHQSELRRAYCTPAVLPAWCGAK